jgi:4-diphosphocytidyl-2-C-methyl-D-erythritol kinase
MVIFPGCIINIGLNVIGKRADGYHKIESIFYPLGLSDILEIIPNEIFSIETSGLPIKGDHSDNLVVKAYYLLQDKYDIPPVKIHLHKLVPMGAGLGGGSADGAAMLVLLNNLFELDISIKELEIFADELGSDCAFFIRNEPAFVQGKGEIINPITVDLKGMYIHLVNPQIHISTQEAFGGIVPFDNNANLPELIQTDINNWKSELKNDFETSIFPNHAEIQLLKAELYAQGAIYASMTGTGSSVFGLFSEEPEKRFSSYFEWIARL